jgi:two-component system CheB/CheR fusion protein
LATVIARAIETSRPLIETRRHELTVELPSRPVLVHADPTRLAQVIANLLNNAAKYMEEGGRIRLVVETEADMVVLRIRDTGMGIPAELLPYVFDLFTQGDRSPARTEGGLGVGLTLVRSLVAMHGGTVEASSEGPGRGSEFVLRLPLLPAQPRAAEAASQHVQQGRRTALRVLVVDDNPDAAQSLALFMKAEGHEVRTATDGPSALALAKQYRPDLILLDIGLPGMDGYEVARRIRQDDEIGRAQLIAVTGYGQEEDRRQAREAGFDAHLIKPTELADLQRVLAETETRQQ